jgi:hypothetical protein
VNMIMPRGGAGLHTYTLYYVKSKALFPLLPEEWNLPHQDNAVNIIENAKV